MGFYSFIGFLRPAIYFFLLPVYVAYFSEAEYAIYNLMIDFAAISMVLVSLKINNSMVTHYYDYMDDPQAQEDLLSNLFTISILIGLVTIGIAWFGGTPLFELVFKDEAVTFFPYGLIVLAYTVLFEANQCYLTFLKNRKKIIAFTMVMLTHVLSIVLLQFIFIIVLERGVTGALEGILIGNILVTAVMIIMKPGLISFKFNTKYIAEALKFSIPLIPYMIIYWFLMRGGRFFLEAYTDLDTVAVFAMLMVLASVIILAVEAVINGIRPFLFEEFARGEAASKQYISLLTRLVINIPLIFVPLIILISCFIHLIIIKESYFVISEYMPWACLLIFLMVWYKLFYQQLIFVKKSVQVTVLSLIAMLCLLIGFVYFIPSYGIYGVLAATIIANLVMVVLFYYYAQKNYYVAYSFKSILVNPLLVFACIFALYFGRLYYSWSWELFGLLQFFAALLLIVVLNFGNMKEYIDFFRKGSLHSHS